MEAQRAHTSGETERALQHLARAEEALEALAQAETSSPGLTATATLTQSRPLTVLEALERDLRASRVDPLLVDGWLVIPLPAGSRSGHVSKQQRAILQELGRLLRSSYATALLSVRAADPGSPESAHRDALTTYLEEVEQLPSSRLLPPPALKVEHPLWVALTVRGSGAAG